MNIFTRKKTLLATIADLNKQIHIQSCEMARLRKANTDLNSLWRDAVKENKGLKDETLATKEAMRAKGMEHAAALGEKNKTIEGLKADIDEKDHTIADLQDANSGLASSVSEMKSKLREKINIIRELKAKLKSTNKNDSHEQKPSMQ